MPSAKRSSGFYEIFVLSSLYGVILLAALLAGLIAAYPSTADWLSYEDFIIESLTALGALIASVVVLVLSIVFFFKKSYLRGTFALLMAVAFFVIGMEEISWMQRILDIEPGEFFMQNNIQKETNFHNLNTSLAMMVFSTIVFIVFTVVPFLKKPIGHMLDRLRLSKLKVFIPSRWLIVIFAISSGFSMAYIVYPQLYHMAILALTALLLLYFVFVRAPKYVQEHKIALYLAILVSLGAATAINVNVYEGAGVRAWFPSEYREFFICLGIFFYSIDLALRVYIEPKKLKPQASRRSSK